MDQYAALTPRPQDDSEGQWQTLDLDGLNLPDHVATRTEVVSPSQSAFGRVNEDEGEAGEGEAPPEDEEDDFESSELEGDWDTVRILLNHLTLPFILPEICTSIPVSLSLAYDPVFAALVMGVTRPSMSNTLVQLL